MEPYKKTCGQNYLVKPYTVNSSKPKYDKLIFSWLNFFLINIMAISSFFFDPFLVSLLFFTFFGILVFATISAICELFMTSKSKRIKGTIIFIATYIMCFSIFQLQLNMYLNFYLFDKHRTEIAMSEAVIKIDSHDYNFPLYPSGLVWYKNPSGNKNVYFRINYNGTNILTKENDPIIHKGFFYTENTFIPDKVEDMSFDYVRKINKNWYYISSLR